MNSIFYTIILAITFTACSTQNAFSNFNLSFEEEKSILSSKSTKIVSHENINGIFSAIYLNEVNPTKYQDYESFYISVYQKNSDSSVHFILNKHDAVSVQELDKTHILTKLSYTNQEWYRYYFVTFKKNNNNNLELLLQSNNNETLLTFKKKSD